MQISDHQDLPVLKLDGIDCPFLIPGNADDLAEGSQLFTNENPSGLIYTVISGVFSGFREEDGKKFLQTDAPINPGNSGGPLIDRGGRFVGIDTLIYRTLASRFRSPRSITPSRQIFRLRTCGGRAG